MRAYKVTASDDGEVLGTRFAGTQADVRTKRDELMEQFNVKKSAIETEEVEIPMAKGDLLEFINELSSNSDATEGDNND